MIGFEQAILVNMNMSLLIAEIIAWSLPLILYIIIGCIRRGRSPSGQKYSDPMICYSNFWIAVGLWIFQGFLLLILQVYPIWLKLFA